VTRISAGLWLSTAAGEVPPAVLALMAEPGRPSLVVDAAGPDQRTDELIGQLFPVLSSGSRAVRLVLSAAADRYAAAARANGLDLIAAEAAVAITPYGYAVVRSAEPVSSERLPQWRRCLAGADQSAAGVLSPSPDWERQLAGRPLAVLGRDITVRRVPAGLVLDLAGPDAGAAQAADAVWPDPERVTIVIGGAGQRSVLRDALADLLPLLPLGATDGVRLFWPRAGAGAGPALQALATNAGTDLIAPAADVSISGFGGVCHGPAGAAPWLRFTSQGDVQVLGSLYPVPAWELGLAEADLSGLPGTLRIEHIAAGLCICWPGPAQRGLLATARSIIPDPSQATIVIGGAVRDHDVRRDVESVLGRLPAAAARRLRILLADAGSRGQDSYAQFLADTFGGQVAAPPGRWTATPDGRVRALPSVAAGPGTPAATWQQFWPRNDHAAPPSPAPAGWPAPAAIQEPRPHQLPGPQPVPVTPPAPVAIPLLVTPPVAPAPPAFPAAAGPVVPGQPPTTGGVAGPPVPPSRVVLLARDHRSSAQDRLRYRESAARYQSYVVAVRRMLTQRPGLRAAAAGDAEDAVVTDFAAVLDFLADDHRGAAAALRTAGPAGDPRMPCVISGLRRLPSFTGAVFSSASVAGPAASGYVTGAIVTEPAFVYATSSRLVALEGNIGYVIWSQTGKRVAALAADAGRHEIIFAAGTTYKVLQVDLGRPRTGQARVFLREASWSGRPGGAARPSPVSQPGKEPDEMDRRVLDRLVTAAALRDDVAAEDQVPGRLAGSAALPIGLDAGGVPFQEGTAGA